MFVGGYFSSGVQGYRVISKTRYKILRGEGWLISLPIVSLMRGTLRTAYVGVIWGKGDATTRGQEALCRHYRIESGKVSCKEINEFPGNGSVNTEISNQYVHNTQKDIDTAYNYPRNQ